MMPLNFYDLGLPDDLDEALQLLHLAIQRHKLAGWREVSQEDVLAVLDDFRSFAGHPQHGVSKAGHDASLPVFRRCRICGCTDVSACIDGGEPCHWVADDLCSACVGSEDDTQEFSDEDLDVRWGVVDLEVRP